MDGTVEKTQLLERVRQASVPAYQTFVLDFKSDASRAQANIAQVNADFIAAFHQKVENDAHEADLQVFRLKKTASDSSILSALGTSSESRLSDLWTLLLRQRGGETGPLLNDGKGNLFYIQSKEKYSDIWAVNVKWVAQKNGWQVDAYSTTQGTSWPGGRQVLGRSPTMQTEG
ncbi:hypothetical protein HY969_02860 [Candidatus Kaiserbacteria bacterium]|nr:hypothetical protein [Candidatus Kaiserbacteria bacterium]